MTRSLPPGATVRTVFEFEGETLDLNEPDPKPGRQWIPREAWRQEKAVVWVRGAVIEPHLFLAYDRAMPRGDQSHLFQWRRGVRADTLDTELLAYPSRSFRFEFKAPGQRVKDGDGQDLMIRTLRDLGVFSGWGVTIMDLCRFYAASGVKMAPNAEFQAMLYDGMVESRIAKAEGRVPGVKKKSRARKSSPRFTAGKRMARKMHREGMG